MIFRTTAYLCSNCGKTSDFKRPNQRCPHCNRTFAVEKITRFEVVR